MHCACCCCCRCLHAAAAARLLIITEYTEARPRRRQIAPYAHPPPSTRPRHVTNVTPAPIHPRPCHVIGKEGNSKRWGNHAVQSTMEPLSAGECAGSGADEGYRACPTKAGEPALANWSKSRLDGKKRCNACLCRHSRHLSK